MDMDEEDTFLEYWRTSGQEWDCDTEERYGADLNHLLDSARSDMEAVNRAQRNGFSADTATVSRQFEVGDAGTVKLVACFYKDGSFLTFELHDGTAFMYVPAVNDRDDAYFMWSSGKVRPFGLEGEHPDHVYEAAGFMFEANRDRVEEVLREIL